MATLTHPAGTSGPYKPDSAQHQIDFYKLREGLALDHNMKLQDEIKDLRAHLLSERRQKDAAQARADLAEKRLAAAKADQTAALDKLIAEAELRGMEHAAIIANKLLVRTKFGNDTLKEVVYSDFVGAAILAASKKGGV